MMPTAEQVEVLQQWTGVCRLVWNLALEQRSVWWRQYQRQVGSSINLASQCRELTELRREFAFINDCPVEAEQRVLRNLDRAFGAFFRGKAGFPAFKRKGANDAISFGARWVKFERLNAKWGRVRLPKIGWVKFRQTREITGRVVDVTLSVSGEKWGINIGAEVDKIVKNVGGTVGVDRGVAVPIALSDGQVFQLPQSLASLAKLQAKTNRVVSRRKRGSKRHALAKQRVSRISARIARIRKDWGHRATTDIARQYGTVVIERLRTKDMIKSAAGTIEAPGVGVAQKRGLNRAILNVAWHQIEAMLAYKAFRLVKVNPAYSSQTCSSCGTVDGKSRKNQASFVCTSCGFRDNADRNAAAVILIRGNTADLGVEGSGCAPCEAPTSGQPLTIAA